MRLILYGTDTDKPEPVEIISSIPELSYRHIQTENHSDRDSYFTGLSGNPPAGIVIIMDGAGGMEGVISAKTLCRME